MNATTLKVWANQFSTIAGALIGCPAVIGLLTHALTVQQAIPLFVASVIGLLYPENKQLAVSGQTTATDIETMIPQLLTAYRTGLTHGAAAVSPAPVPLSIPTQILTPAVPASPAP